MAKILSIIILIALIGGGGWYYTNKMKVPSEGVPVAGLFSKKTSSQPLTITSPIDGLTVGATYTMEWTGSAPRNVREYYIYLINASSSKNILLGTVKSSANKFDFKVSTSTTVGVVEGWKLSMFDKQTESRKSIFDSRQINKQGLLLAESSSFIISHGYENYTSFYSSTNGIASVDVRYTVSISRDQNVPKNVPKMKINCPEGVSAVLSTDYLAVDNNKCGQEIIMTKQEVIDNGFVYVYFVNLKFTNSNPTNKIVNSQADFDDTTVINREDLIIPPTNSSLVVPKG